MDIEERSNTMARPVLVVEARGPQRSSCQSVETVAHSVAGEDSSAEGNVTLEHKSETLLLLLRGCAKGDCSSDVSSSIVILCTRVTEVKLLGRERPGSGSIRLVVDHSTIWTRRRDSWKTQRYIVRLLSNTHTPPSI